MLSLRNEPSQYALSAMRLETEHKLQLIIATPAVTTINALSPNERRGVAEMYQLNPQELLAELAHGKTFGYAKGPLKCFSDNEAYLTVEIPLPLCEEDRGPCDECKGTGKEDDESNCRRCFGKGREYRFIHEEARAICISLSVLLHMLNATGLREQELDAMPPRQLIRVDTAIQDHSAPLYGEFSGPIVHWLDVSIDKELITIPIVRTMRAVLARMLPSFADKASEREFAAEIQQCGWLTFSCFGDRSFVYPTDRPRTVGRIGYPFSCHNVDSAHQQLMLLAGLATLTDLARIAGVDHW